MGGTGKEHGEDHKLVKSVCREVTLLQSGREHMQTSVFHPAVEVLGSRYLTSVHKVASQYLEQETCADESGIK